MGIKDYHKWMKATYPCAFSNYWLPTYDNLYIDINFALHWSHYGAKSEADIFRRLFFFLDKIIAEIAPSSSIIIASDGQAPLAKLLLQRERRVTISKTMTPSELKTSTLIFTPGTTFMDSLKQKLKPYFAKIEHVYGVKTHYYIGCHGEAELKIKRELMKNIDDDIATNVPNTHVIVSNDADVIAMFGALDESAYNRIFIFCDIKKPEIISMGSLMHNHFKKYGNHINSGLDFTLISILLGNDYLPKLSYTNLDKLWDSYTYSINIHAQQICTTTTNGRVNINIKLLISLMFDILMNTPSHFYKSYTYKYYTKDVQKYKNYMEGLIWCMDMYSVGECLRYDYMYNYSDPINPYGFMTFLGSYERVANSIPRPVIKCIDKDLYAIIVLPIAALELVPKQFRRFAEKHKDKLYEVELCETCVAYENRANDDNLSDFKKALASAMMINHKDGHHQLVASDIAEIATLFEEWRDSRSTQLEQNTEDASDDE